MDHAHHKGRASHLMDMATPYGGRVPKKNHKVARQMGTQYGGRAKQFRHMLDIKPSIDGFGG